MSLEEFHGKLKDSLVSDEEIVAIFRGFEKEDKDIREWAGIFFVKFRPELYITSVCSGGGNMELEEFAQNLLDSSVSDSEIITLFKELFEEGDIEICQKAENILLRIRPEAHRAYISSQGVEK